MQTKETSMLRSLSAIEEGITVVDQNQVRWFDAEL